MSYAARNSTAPNPRPLLEPSGNHSGDLLQGPNESHGSWNYLPRLCGCRRPPRRLTMPTWQPTRPLVAIGLRLVLSAFVLGPASLHVYLDRWLRRAPRRCRRRCRQRRPSSGANRNPLDYNKVIRGFTAAAKQHTKAAFVPTPADAIEAILFELTDRVDILAKINLARPYTPKVAMARFTVDTGDALANQSHEAIMSSLFASTQTDTVKSLLSEFVQVTRLGRGGIMVSVTSSNALKALGGQYLSIMGKKYIIPVHEEQPLDSLCFMDNTGIRDNFDATQFYRKLTQLGVDVVYHSVCAVLPGTGCHTNTWRVYFTDAAIPAQLQINGEPINQIKYQRFYYRVYFKGTKGTAFRSVNGGSTHCVDIEAKR
ncbi:hypothetical protein H257_16162 [Aphanomyces astaci]|uniref:Uncharacterized protein n=1 Tax=Aphanomyces astaci TaxID=112090 RepID=W4FLD9_APHAT|nr:hypothetical protein H257_16162 [Aphanomyces astaci]ETV67696.1 hypothetical protein H257_16162 [Aphanomyces astaci]|eukprot:XP_009842817.1 hypothetical protein H257_16162 [Aphanomyces astaci]